MFSKIGARIQSSAAAALTAVESTSVGKSIKSKLDSARVIAVRKGEARDLRRADMALQTKASSCSEESVVSGRSVLGEITVQLHGIQLIVGDVERKDINVMDGSLVEEKGTHSAPKKFHLKVYVEGKLQSTEINVTTGTFTFPVTDITSDICIQLWTSKEFQGQAMIPVRHLCTLSPAPLVGKQLAPSGVSHDLCLRLWPLPPEAAKFQSGIQHMKGSAMKRNSIHRSNDQSTAKSAEKSPIKGGVNHADNKPVAQEYIVSLTVALNVNRSLPMCLFNGKPYRISPGSEDPRVSHVIDWYYLKKGILRVSAILETEPKWISALKFLRSWKNPLVSTIFMCVVIAIWWKINNIVWVPLAISVLIVSSSVFTVVAQSSQWPSNATKNSSTAAGKLGRLQPIVWQHDVGVDPEDLLAKLRSVHGLLSRAAVPLNKYASIVEKVSNAFAGTDPAVTMVANVCVVLSGIALSAAFWIIGLIGCRNAALILFFVGMTPSPITSAISSSDSVSNDHEHQNHLLRGLLYKWLLNFIGFLERVPDEEEVMHRRIANSQIVAPFPQPDCTNNKNDM